MTEKPATRMQDAIEPEKVQIELPDGVEVWQLGLRADAFEAALHLLSADERWRAGRWRQPEDRLRFALTRAALRRLLGRRLDCAPHTLCIRTCRNGKPYLAGERKLNFNVSHAGDFALIAMSDRGEVGIDIEHRAPWLDEISMRDYMLSPLERELPLDFLERWVAKEAVFKALGVGVGAYLQQLSVFASTAGRYLLAHAQPNWPSLHACRLPAPEGYAAALGWLGSEASPRNRPAV